MWMDVQPSLSWLKHKSIIQTNDEQTNKRTDEQTNKRTDEQTNRWTNEQTNKRRLYFLFFFLLSSSSSYKTLSNQPKRNVSIHEIKCPINVENDFDKKCFKKFWPFEQLLSKCKKKGFVSELKKVSRQIFLFFYFLYNYFIESCPQQWKKNCEKDWMQNWAKRLRAAKSKKVKNE